ncbi:MAG: hypothetical protein AAGE83_00750 [Pseudomonadota bacterium]
MKPANLALVLLLAGVALPPAAALAQSTPPARAAPEEPGLRDTGPALERFGAIREMLDEAAEARSRARRGEEDIIDRLYRSSPEERAERLLSEAFEIVSDTPVTELRREIEEAQTRIEAAEREIAALREERLFAPEETSFWERAQGTKDRAGVEASIAALEAEIADRQAFIERARKRFIDAMARVGSTVSEAEADLLLGGVTGGDILAIASAYSTVRDIAAELRRVVAESGEEISSARRYYTLHTTLIALLAHAQETFIAKIDDDYLPKLEEIEDEVRETRAETDRLLRGSPTPEQRRVLEANRRSQKLTLRAAGFYRDYLERQRDEVASALWRTRQDLAVADNTLRTVDASFRLLEIMREAELQFEALEALESPGLDTLFENEELRREFESLSDRLKSPSS